MEVIFWIAATYVGSVLVVKFVLPGEPSWAEAFRWPYEVVSELWRP